MLFLGLIGLGVLLTAALASWRFGGGGGLLCMAIQNFGIIAWIMSWETSSSEFAEGSYSVGWEAFFSAYIMFVIVPAIVGIVIGLGFRKILK